MCLCKFEKASPEEDIIVVPSRPIPHRNASTSTPIVYSGYSLSTLPAARSRPLSIEQALSPSHSQPRSIEARRLSSQDRVVLVGTITPRSTNPTIHQRGPRGSGSLSQPPNPRHSGDAIQSFTPRRSENDMVLARQSGSHVRLESTVLRPPIRSQRQSSSGFRSPRQSEIGSTSYRSTREKMVEVDEGDGKVVRRLYDRRDDIRR